VGIVIMFLLDTTPVINFSSRQTVNGIDGWLGGDFDRLHT
jgi:hypothetical protein